MARFPRWHGVDSLRARVPSPRLCAAILDLPPLIPAPSTRRARTLAPPIRRCGRGAVTRQPSAQTTSAAGTAPRSVHARTGARCGPRTCLPRPLTLAARGARTASESHPHLVAGALIDAGKASSRQRRRLPAEPARSISRSSLPRYKRTHPIMLSLALRHVRPVVSIPRLGTYHVA